VESDIGDTLSSGSPISLSEYWRPQNVNIWNIFGSCGGQVRLSGLVSVTVPVRCWGKEVEKGVADHKYI